MSDSAVEVDVSKRCVHNCFWISLGSNSQWHLPAAGTFSSAAEEAWVFHQGDEAHDDNSACDCFWSEDGEWLVDPHA